jgi:hypothetical protein
LSKVSTVFIEIQMIRSVLERSQRGILLLLATMVMQASIISSSKVRKFKRNQTKISIKTMIRRVNVRREC